MVSEHHPRVHQAARAEDPPRHIAIQLSGARATRLACGILLAAAIIACACGLPLAWDGAHQLAASLVEQRPFASLDRFHSWPLWWPCVLLSRFTDSLPALTFAFGLPFIAAPAFSLWLCWRVVRKHRPELIVWAAFGVAVAGLPGQAFVISGGIWQQTMFWPVFLGALVPVSQRGRVALGILALFQLSHPAGVLLLLIATLAALSVESQDASLLRAQLGKFVQLGMLFLIACSKAAWGFWPALTGDPLWMPWDGIIAAFNEGSPGAPILGLLAMWFAAFTPFFQSRAVRRLGLLAVLAAGALWAWWAISPGRWAAAVHYRSWAVPAALPFLWCALLAARRSLDLPVALSGRLNVEKPELRLSFEFTPAKPRTDYYLLAVSAALVFCAVITLQSLGWKAMVARLNSEVSSRPGPVVTREAIPFIRQTPLDHWSITALCALHSGSRPEKYVAFSDGKITTPDGGKILLGPNHFIPAAPGPAGWFDHRPLLERLAAEKR